MKHSRPEDLFRAEKERATSARNSQHARLLAEAKAAFDKLMAEGQAARKSGRPRKHPLPPLKTSSSRVLPHPPVAAPAVIAAPATVPAAAPAAKAAPLKSVVAKPEARGSVKRATAPKRVAKAQSRAAKPKASKPKASKPKASKAKSPKAKSKRR